MGAMQRRVDEHVAAFDDAVRSGDWHRFADRFADDAVLDFEGPPVGPFAGRDAIAEAYAAAPPDDTITATGPPTADGDAVVVPYRWDRTGATGTMRLAFDEAGLVTRLVVTFDELA